MIISSFGATIKMSVVSEKKMDLLNHLLIAEGGELKFSFVYAYIHPLQEQVILVRTG
jgi:hypothetical protein